MRRVTHVPAARGQTVGLVGWGQIARRFGLPWRSGGGLTSSQTVDYQAGYESLNTLVAAFLA